MFTQTMPVRIMIVDDEVEVLRTLRKILTRRGHQVVAFSNPLEALEHLKKEKVDLIFTDLKMPELDGTQFLVQAKRIAPNVPVILVTAFATIDSAVTAMKNGAFNYLKKPFDIKIIDDIVMQAVGLSQARDCKNSGSWIVPCLGVFMLLTASGCAGKTVRPAQMTGPSAPLIAVLPFESANPNVPGATLSDYFTVEILQNMQKVQVIERKDLLKILQEQQLTLTGITKPEKFSKLGSILGVHAILVGSVQTLENIQEVGGAIAVTVKLMDVRTGKILWADYQKISMATWSVREKAEVAQALMEKAAKRMVKRLDKSAPAEGYVFDHDKEPRVIREAKLNSYSAQ